MKTKVVYWLKFVVKYVFPALIGWLEGDTHAIYDLISGVLSVI